MKDKLVLKLIALLSLMAASPCLADSQTVTQKDKNFSVTDITIQVGDSITFKNMETDVTHNVYSITKDHEFELKVQRPGESSTIKFDKPGKVVVECAIHPGMRMIVNVAAAAQ